MATTHSQQIVQKLWNYCNLLRDDGLSYSEQLNVSVGTGFRRAAAAVEPAAGVQWAAGG